MKKIANFIVNKRHFILVTFIILAIICGIISFKVNINYDITKYLPGTSETRIGMDIMEKEFADVETSSFSLMFENLPENQKQDVKNYLNEIEGVKEVKYEENEEYNKDRYTLYVITVDDDADSKLASDVFKNVTEKYKDYKIYTSGDISDRNSEVLPKTIIALAIFCALIILIIMCDSYIEPFLFLFSILIAVLFNKGTNIIFPSISYITDSISAILQLALSMDYSIMLMNRYNQEKEKEQDKVKAMKNALHNALKSISSSSLTTIVGLIVLVFMSFTIGRDLGLILAKGVLFSLLSIFFVLPGLILIFDKLILKTKKKSLNIKLNWLGKFAYKIRYISIPIFLFVFIGSYFLKGNLQILYTNTEDNNISKVFKNNNQMAIVYKSEDEEKIANIINSIKNDEKVDEVLAYSNTINENLAYDELKGKLNDLGSNIDIEDYFIKILYYDYYSKQTENKMTFEEFVGFIKRDVYSNEDMKDTIDEKKKKDIDRFENFIHKSSINENKTKDEISKIMDIDKEKLEDIFVLYSAKNDDTRISINAFVNFINNEVLNDNKYYAKFDDESKVKLNKLSKYIIKSKIQTKMTYKEMADFFEIDENKMKDLYTYYISLNDINTKMTVSEFSSFVLEDVLNDKNYSTSVNKESIENIKMLYNFSNKNIIQKNMDSNELAGLFGLEEEKVSKILLLKYLNQDDGSKMSISDFIKSVIYLKNNTDYLKNVDISSLELLNSFASNENNLNNTKMDKAHLSVIFDNVSKGLVDNIYTLASLPNEFKLSPKEFVDLVLEKISNIPDENKAMLNVNDDSINKLQVLKLVIDDSVSSTGKEFSVSEISNVLGMQKLDVQKLYVLINYNRKNTSNWNASPYEFVSIILNNKENEEIKFSLDENILAKLSLLCNIMKSSLNNIEYSYSEIANFMDINDSQTKNIYTLYVSKNEVTKITPKEFVDFTLEHKNDDMLRGRFSKEQTTNLELIKKVFNGVLNDTKYSKNEISELLGIEKEKTELLYGLYNEKHINTNRTMTLKEFIDFLLNDVITNKEYSDNFDNKTVEKLKIVNKIIKDTEAEEKYTSSEIFAILSILSDDVDENIIDLLFTYYGSKYCYNTSWKLTIEEFVRYLNDDILNNTRYEDYITDEVKNKIIDAKDTINDAKKMLIGKEYSRAVINTKFDSESEETFEFIRKVKDLIESNNIDAYVIGNSCMAYEMSKTFNGEMNFITVLTMISIFLVVAITFKSILTPIILVFVIQCAVYITMTILHITGDSVYFIALLIVQSILMGATIDYAILYTSYYMEHRKTMNIKDAIINSYNKSIHTILNSSSILIIVTLIVANFASAIAAKICKTISEGTFCSTILILVLLPAMLAACDKFIMRKNK